MTGKHVLSKARDLPKGTYKVVCFIRNPSKLSDSDKANIEFIEGDCTNVNDVKSCITVVKPDAIILTTSLGFTNEIRPLNQILVPAIVEALSENGRLDTCHLIYLSGAGSPNTPSAHAVSYGTLFSWIIWIAKIKAAVFDNSATHDYFHSTPEALDFVVVKMGMVSEGESKGVLVGVKCSEDQPWGAFEVIGSKGVTFVDVGNFLVSIAIDEMKFGKREFLLMEYAV